MGVDSAAAVQAALYGVLTEDAALMALAAGGVFDHVPAGTAFPYVALGGIAAETFGTQDASGNDLVVTLHVYSRVPGMRETQALLAALHDALHWAEFAVAGQALVLCRHLGSETRLEDDGVTRHGIARFRVVTEPQ